MNEYEYVMRASKLITVERWVSPTLQNLGSLNFTGLMAESVTRQPAKQRHSGGSAHG